MASFAKMLIDEALNDQQLKLQQGTSIGSIYLDSSLSGTNWNAYLAAKDADGLAQGLQAIAAVQERYPNVALADMFCIYF